MSKKTNALQLIGFTSIGIAVAVLCYIQYRIDDSKIVKAISVSTEIEKESGFKNTKFKYIHRDGKLDSKSVLEKFDRPLSEIAAKNGCIKMELTFSDWYPWDKYRGLVNFQEIACPF
ncbi:hypothetical protein [Chamaesiphon polymorphus]|uniref:Uncharacterized protein n=1 Tax=Chamaesiphon polymorphus CCALA 037 TaxID=2107692 RepID=A0A2T1GKB1_9CYAN|nr:hypothetical protein [Chamaesiphon polymorphus]PSB58177.1 hypothetical protein C7B77_05730 [Chamaesiphon polymorphus CCALA 037]